MEIGFQILCLLVTIFMIISFLIVFNRDESTTQVDFKRFNNRKVDVYPTFSVCLIGPIWNATKLNETYGINNFEDYPRFLKGEIWDEKILNANYDDVTLSLTDFVNYWGIWINNWINALPDDGWIDSNNSHLTALQQSFPDQGEKILSYTRGQSRFFPSCRSPDHKCYSLNLTHEVIPMTEGNLIRKLLVSFKKLKPSDPSITYFFHYPGQIMSAAGSAPFGIELTKPREGSLHRIKETRIFIDEIQIIRRRNSEKQPCLEESERHDEYMLKQLVNYAGCRPFHYMYDYDFGNQYICNNSDSMRKTAITIPIFADHRFLERFEKPCDQLQMITYRAQNVKMGKNKSLIPEWKLEILFTRDTYKEIRHIMAYNFRSLAADVAAIIGFFCGFSLWQIPRTLKSVIISLKEKKFRQV